MNNKQKEFESTNAEKFILISHNILIKVALIINETNSTFIIIIYPNHPSNYPFNHMEKSTHQTQPNSDQNYRTLFAHQAGISVDQLKDLQFEQPKRQRRQRKDPSTTEHVNKNHSISHDSKTQLLKSPASSTSRQQTNLSSTTPKKQPKPTPTTTPKVSQKQENKCQKAMVSIPKSVDEFYQNYIGFSSRLFKDSEREIAFIDRHKKELFELFDKTIEHGGIVAIISQGYQKQIFQQFLDCFKVTTTDEIFTIYKRFLMHFEYQILQNYTFKEYHNPVPLLQQAIFVDEQQLRIFLEKTPLDPKYFDHDIMVFKNGQDAIHIDSNTIHLDRVAQHYQNYNIDIRIQKAMDYGFKPRTMRNQPYQMKIGHYRTYQKLCQEYAHAQTKIDSNFMQQLGQVKDLDVNGTTFKDRINNQEIFFGVNFDPDDGLLFDEINQKVNGTFLGFKQEFDLLSYLDQQVPGCSFPQFYFKVKGVWTGGHQENINMCSVNINHGPDASEWYSMQFKYVEQFRAQLKKEYKMDLYGSEGLWYEKINWFMEQGKYPIKKILQKKGDIVVSGPGTLHWVRSHGIALQSAWNQFPITLRMMEYAFCRQEENERINFVRSNTIPLKMLTLKLLNHQPPQLTFQIQKLCVEKVKMWMKKQQDLYEEFQEESEQFESEPPRYEKLDDLQGFCTKCLQEILIYFVNGKKFEDILCLNCFKKDYRNKKKTKRVYIRNNLFDLDLLIKKSESGKPFHKLKVFISQYVGNVPFEIKNYKMDKQSVLINKINAMNQDLNKCDSKMAAEFFKKLKNKQSQSEEKDELKAMIPKQQKSNELQKLNEHSRSNQSKIDEQKGTKIETQACKNIKYIGKPSPTGWCSFEIPQRLRIVTQHNYTELLKFINHEQQAVLKMTRLKGLPKKIYPYYVIRSKQYPNDKDTFTKLDNIKFSHDPKFSSDEDEKKDQDTIKKKVHKNQDENSLDRQYQTHHRQHKRKQDSSQSYKQKFSHKHKKPRSSRSKSHQRQRKQSKFERSRSPKDSRKSSHKYSESRHSPSCTRRSKSQEKSSRRQSYRTEQLRSGWKSRNHRDDFRGNNEEKHRHNYDNDRNFKRDRNGHKNEHNYRKDEGSQNRKKSDEKDNKWQDRKKDNWGHSRNQTNNKNNWYSYVDNGHSTYQTFRDSASRSYNYNNKDKNYTKNYNNNQDRSTHRQEYQRNSNNQSIDYYQRRHGQNNQQHKKQVTGQYRNSGKYQHNQAHFKSYNSNNRQVSMRYNQSHADNSKQTEDRILPHQANQTKSRKIVQEKPQNNDFDY